MNEAQRHGVYRITQAYWQDQRVNRTTECPNIELGRVAGSKL